MKEEISRKEIIAKQKELLNQISTLQKEVRHIEYVLWHCMMCSKKNDKCKCNLT